MYAVQSAGVFPGYYYLQPRAKFGDYFRCAAVTLWFASMAGVFFLQGDWYALNDAENRGLAVYIFAGGLGLAALAHLTLGLHKLLASPYVPPFPRVKEILLVGFFVLMMVLSPRSITPVNSALYALLAWACFFLGSCFWKNNPTAVRKAMVVMAILLLAILIALILRFGFFRGSVGGINRNRYGTVAFVAMCAATFARGRIKWPIYLVALGLIAAVTSRSTVVAVVAMFGAYVCLYYGMAKGLKWGALAGLVGVTFILYFHAKGESEDPLLSGLMKVNDASRGFNSGLTGRVERWKEGLETLRGHAMFGYGFRTRINQSVESKSAHSGYINALLDCGFVGAALLIGGFVVDGIQRVRRIWQTRTSVMATPPDSEERFLFIANCLAVSMYATMAGLWISEPMYLNFGHPLTAFFILLIASPRLEAEPARR